MKLVVYKKTPPYTPLGPYAIEEETKAYKKHVSDDNRGKSYMLAFMKR